MKGRHSTGGFTIVETLIFLAISGFVFFAALGGYTKRQREVEFTQGVRSLQARLQDAINDVGSGYYADIPNTCHADAVPTNPAPYFDNNTADASNCVWLGKVLQLGESYYCDGTSTINSDQCNQFRLTPVVARRNYVNAQGDNLPVANYSQAKPVALSVCLTNGDNPDSTPCSGSSQRPDMSDRGTLPGNIGVYRIFVRQAANGIDSSIRTGGIGFMSSLNVTGTSRLGSASTVDVVPIPCTSINTTEASMTDRIDALGFPTPSCDHSTLPQGNGVTVCISGAFNQKAAITIGADRRQLDVQVQPSDKIDPGCA